MTRRGSSYSMPGSSGADDFRAKQEPAFEPVDDLSRFVLDRIRETETEPVADQVEPNGQPMAYRYAKHVRRDMVAFRRVVAIYCEVSVDGGVPMAAIAAYRVAVKAIAMRWSDHHDFQDSWRLS